MAVPASREHRGWARSGHRGCTQPREPLHRSTAAACTGALSASSARSARAGLVQRSLNAPELREATHRELVPHPREPRGCGSFRARRVLDQVQLSASVQLDGAPDAGREFRIGAEHLLNLVIEGMPYRVGHGSIVPLRLCIGRCPPSRAPRHDACLPPCVVGRSPPPPDYQTAPPDRRKPKCTRCARACSWRRGPVAPGHRSTTTRREK